MPNGPHDTPERRRAWFEEDIPGAPDRYLDSRESDRSYDDAVDTRRLRQRPIDSLSELLSALKEIQGSE